MLCRHRQVVLKPAFGLSGRGHRRLSQLTADDAAWAETVFATQGHLVVEPWFDRVADFSVQCEFDGSHSRLKGFTALEVTANGRFIACAACARFASLFPMEVSRFFNADGRGPWLRQFYERQVLPIVDQHLGSSGFRGAWGIDAFIHRDNAGSLRLRPIVEINPRHTMGRVAFELLRITAPARMVQFSLATITAARARGVRSLIELGAVLEKCHPTQVVIINGQPRLASGTIILNEPARAARFLGVIEVRDARKPAPAPDAGNIIPPGSLQ
jgi:hypothetical protein